MKGLRCISDCNWDNHYYGFYGSFWEFLFYFFTTSLLIYFLKLGRIDIDKTWGICERYVFYYDTQEGWS
jgi:hypothetical protein